MLGIDIPKLKILDYLDSIFTDIQLENTYVFCVQHVLATTISLFNSLLKKGLKPENLSVLGKCYSTRPEAYQYLKEMNVDVSPLSTHFDSKNSFDEDFKKNLIGFFMKRLHKVKHSNFEKIIVLDDGGELISLANEYCMDHPEWSKKFLGIEQTTAGYDKLKNHKLNFSVINVARSDIKLIYESPFIAKAAVNRIKFHLDELGLYPKNALIIGNGAIGSNIYSLLQDDYAVEIVDHKTERSSMKDFEIEDIQNFDLIIGCTGKKVLLENHFKYLKPNACLVSVSSSDREFSAAHLRRKLNEEINSCHQNVFADNVYLLNCGFPINFDAAYELVDMPEIELTRSILLAAIYQSLSFSLPKGLDELDSMLQEKILRLYKEQYLNKNLKFVAV